MIVPKSPARSGGQAADQQVTAHADPQENIGQIEEFDSEFSSGNVRDEPIPHIDASSGRASVSLSDFLRAARSWTVSTKVAIFALVLLYIPVLRDAWHAWTTNDDYSHGVFILPVAAALVWMRRNEIAKAQPEPAAWAMGLLILGLVIESAGYLLSIGFFAIVSLVPVLAGAVLVFHGRKLWNIVGFAICFLAFASTVPGSLTARPSQWIQRASTDVAFDIVSLAGYPVMQHGSVIEIPGMQLEVAEVCSGFKKLVALLAFSTLYGYLFKIGIGKRLLLVAAAIPIAVAANALRIAGLVGVASAFGSRGVHAAHDGAEVAVLVIAFCLFTLLGKLIGCRTLRFSL